jgi:hypothetical protein
MLAVVDGPSLTLYRGPPPANVSFPVPPTLPVVAGDIAAGLVATWAIVQGVLAMRRKLLVSFDRTRREVPG